ncbi:PIPO, partial [Hardenbergia mosaic virus]|uniref:PIPO n=1 Tax=Hardenbergia mosaic virus TaxID=409486 RepID=UPI0002655027
NLSWALKTGVARFKLAGKILCNLAIEKVLTFYGGMFDKESCRRKNRIARHLCECVFFKSDHIPQKCARVCITTK